jgi:hypothetical protein
MALTTDRPTEAELPDVRPTSSIYTTSAARTAHPRSVVAKFTGVLFQPAMFFRTMPVTTNRHYLWIMLLILALISASAVQRSSVDGAGADFSNNQSGDPGLSGAMPGVSGNFVEAVPRGGGLPPGVQPNIPPSDGGGSVSTAPAIPISEVWTTIMLVCAGMLTVWIVQSILLCEVSLFNSTAPNWGRNFQIAVWASLPLGLMGGLQLLYQSAGGQISQPGLSGLVDLIPGYSNMPETIRQGISGIAANFTLFGLWSVMLLYLGARHGLRGKRLTSLLVVTLWLLVIGFAPVAFETVKAARRAARDSAVNGISTPSADPFDSGVSGTPSSTESAMPSATDNAQNGTSLVDPETPIDQGGGK